MPSKAKFAMLRAWSYSVYTQYINCPFSVCLDKILKVRMVEPPNPHFLKGNMVHDAAEAQVRLPKAPPLIPELVQFSPHFADFRRAKARVAEEWAFTKDYLQTGWFSEDCWLRVKTDACKDTKKPPLVHIVDYKTGRVYNDHKQQRSLYAMAGLVLVRLGMLAGGSEKVKLTAAHFYTDTGQTATEQFTMKDLAPLQREWETRIKEMMSDTAFPTKTGRWCGWCKHAKSKGGSCPENQ